MTIITSISLLQLASLLPHLTFTAHVNVGIVNGTVAEAHSRPYMVSIQKNRQHICGGFLISDQFVLTAAHCHMKDEELTAVVGAHNLKNENEGSVRIGVKSNIKKHDIMLLQLQKKITRSENVNWILLPKKQNKAKKKHKKIPNKDPDCSVAGWGSLYMNGPGSDCLMEAKVNILDHATCKNQWRKLCSQMICAYGHGGSCEGDSGGPLVCGDTAVGVTSFGDAKNCNSLNYPNVYTKISSYLQWIHKNMKQF
ncbi:chymotrypsin-C-like [Pimephales promelas]|uniref:chymotrypsin-C-like n=1 Tax=Pimephales promelas TaxID=90988 RepID=UPI001955DAC9|nr:chymotrypsin-C-like [Pimephales promelas]